MTFTESTFKSVLPGKKVVYRVSGNALNKYFIADIIALPEEDIESQPQIKVVTIAANLQRYIIIPTEIRRITQPLNLNSSTLDE